MKKVLVAVIALAIFLPLGVVGQDIASQLKDFTRSLRGNGVQLTLIHLNDKTVALMFQPPTLYAMRVRAKQSTMLYVQGTPQQDVEFDTTNFLIEQGGESITSTPSNIKHFEKGKVAKGDQIDGVLQFAKQIDLSKPFKVVHGKDSVEFKFSGDQVKAMTLPAPQP